MVLIKGAPGKERLRKSITSLLRDRQLFYKLVNILNYLIKILAAFSTERFITLEILDVKLDKNHCAAILARNSFRLQWWICLSGSC